MSTTFSRWLVVLALIASVIVWLGVSVVTDDAVHTLAKSNFDFARTYGSVSLTTLLIALAWSLVVGGWMMVSTPVGTKNLVFGLCAVTISAVVLTFVAAVGSDLLWSFRWASIAFGIAIWSLEIVIAVWLLRRTSQPLSYGIGLNGSLWTVTTALAWLMAAKAALLCVSPGVAIRF